MLLMKNFFKNVVIAILTLEARFLLQKMKPKIVGITGSVGKTSTKEAISTVLKSAYSVRASEKSFNSDIGVALTILGLSNGWNNPFMWVWNICVGAFRVLVTRSYPEILVLELGVDHKGDMARLTSWIKPDIAVVTALPDVPVHVENFSSPEEVIAEKMLLVKALTHDGVFVYNNDDQKIVSFVPEIRQKSVGYSRYSVSSFMIQQDEVEYENGLPCGMHFTVTHDGKHVQIRVHNSLGIQHAYTCAAALAVGIECGVSLLQGAEALKNPHAPRGRMRLIAGVEDTLIIDDTYNSSPTACMLALDTLRELSGARKIAVLGDMLELGSFSVAAHERVGMHAKDVDFLYTLGERSEKIAEGALSNGLSEKNIFQHETTEELIEQLRPTLQKGDIILVKASQGMRAEKIVYALMADKVKAKELLVRQDNFWMK
jgi:UDP-N-acetylmuramoyl-tripeptide--D-alanyl-D-alanine ligase